jgi:hypothetical protein
VAPQVQQREQDLVLGLGSAARWAEFLKDQLVEGILVGHAVLACSALHSAAMQRNLVSCGMSQLPVAK